MTVETFAAFLGWVTLINIGFLTISTIGMWLFRGMGIRLHAKMFDLTNKAILQVWYQYLGYFKLLIIVFNLAPYLALRLIL